MACPDKIPSKSAVVRGCGWMAVILASFFWGLLAIEATSRQILIAGPLPYFCWLACVPLAVVWCLGTIVYRSRIKAAQTYAAAMVQHLARLQAQGAAVTQPNDPLPFAPRQPCRVCGDRRVIGKRTSTIDPERPCPACAAVKVG